jgi:hypothetical protein
MPTLEESRTGFLKGIRAYTRSSERPVFEAILDDFIAWSDARPERLAHAERHYKQHVVSFLDKKSHFIVWSAYPRADDGAKLEIFPGVDTLGDEARSHAVEVLGGVCRDPISEEATLRVPFPALRSDGSRERVKALIDELLLAIQ